MFFLSPIDSCLVSFFVHVNNLCLHVRLDWQLRVAPDDIFDYGLEAKTRWEVMVIGMFRDLAKEHHLARFLGLNMWHVFLTFLDVFIVGKCIFQKSLGPGICSCNPTSLLLDSRLQSTVSLFGTVSLYVCVN